MIDDVEHYKTSIDAQLHAVDENLYFIGDVGKKFNEFGVFWNRGSLQRISPSSPFKYHCPSCGASVEFAAEKLHWECDQCLADLFPGNEQGLASAQALRLYTHALLIRTGRADVFIRTMFEKNIFIGVAILLALAFLQSLTRLALFPLIFLSLIVGVSAAMMFIVKKRSDMTLLFRRQVDGVFINSPKKILNWLDYHWPATYGYSDLPTRYITLAIKGEADGFPVLLWFDAMPFYERPKIHIFLSAWVPGVSDVIEDETPLGSDKAEEIKRSLTDGGFEVRVQEAGILIQATPATVRAGKKNPSLFFKQLPETLNKLTGLAQAYQCSPRPA